jgi:hypothetical protein
MQGANKLFPKKKQFGNTLVRRNTSFEKHNQRMNHLRNINFTKNKNN